MQRRDQDMSVAESLGAFVGAIWGGIASTPGAPGRAADGRPDADGTRSARTVATRVEDREVDGVILRRTIIDEVIVPPQGAATNDPTRTNHATH
ncbi:MAG: hypothetical protein RJA05_1915 [Planctomycetota bacterium]|jgi:hypothetical protein